MNIEKLEIGRKYTYKELCALFGQAEKTHHSRDAQKKEWERHFRWSNPKKQKYLIEEIYDTPLEKIDGRANNGGNSTSKYLSLDDIIMDYFTEQEELICTLPGFAVKLGILTNQYSQYKNNARQFSEDRQIPEELVWSYINAIRSCVIDAIRMALGRLQKEGYLEVEYYFSLILSGGSRVKFTGEQIKEITALENQVLEEMGISRVQLYIATHYRDYRLKFKEKILEKHGYEIDYHYKECKIKRVKADYQDKGKDSVGRLTRKFIITICNSMLKDVCRLGKEYGQGELVENIIEMSNCFFTYMNDESWNRFWDDEELSMRNESKSFTFWSQFCLTKLHMDLVQKEAEKRREATATQIKVDRKQQYRELVIKELGEENVIYFENIFSALDWERVYTDEDYLILCDEVLNAYDHVKYLFGYSQDEHVEDYCLYVARLVEHGRADEQMTFDDFIKQFDAGKI